MLTPKTNTSA